MSFAKALRVKRGDVISFVGGGGKTSSMFRLAAELSSAGYRVLTTTTTHISEAQAKMAPSSIEWNELEQLGENLDRYRHCLLVGRTDGKGRVLGASPELIDSLHNRSDLDCILVEADGSRSRPFKAPGDHEPVVPQATTILVPIAGLNAIGRGLDEENAHRSERIAALSNQELGSPITPATLAGILSHPLGGAKQLPAGARLVPLLNKADTNKDMRNARDAAGRLLSYNNVDSIIVSVMIEALPVREAWTSVAGIILAAGRSIRYGATKQMLAWKDTTLVAYAARQALDAGMDPVVAVTGCDAELVEKALGDLPVRTVYNPDFEQGQSTSIRKGLDALSRRTGAALFVLADQPLATAPVMRKIIAAHRSTFAPVCVPISDGKRGNPVLFDQSVFGELSKLSGDIGGRVLLEKYRDSLVTVPCGPEVLMDIDTVEDYEKQKQVARSRKPE